MSVGYDGMHDGKCPERKKDSAPLSDTTKSLVLINYFPTIPFKHISCKYNSNALLDMLRTCQVSAGNRWANFIAVDYFEVHIIITSLIANHFLITLSKYL